MITTVTGYFEKFDAEFETEGEDIHTGIGLRSLLILIHGKIFGLVWNAVTEAGAVVVSDDICIQAEVQFIKQV